MTKCDQSPPRRRTRTAPDLKYLLNDRAAAAGVVAGFDRRIAGVEAQVRELQARLQQLQCDMEDLCAQRQAPVAELHAIEAVLTDLHPGWRSARVVNAWAGKYGERGDRKAFVLQFVRQAGPGGVSAVELTRAVRHEFSLNPPTLRGRANLRTSLRNQLRRLEAAGVLRQHSGPDGPRWTWDAGPSALDLLELAGHEPDPDPAGGEVVGQRAGGNRG